MEIMQFIIGGIFLLSGVVIFLIEVYGVFRFKYVLNRMHAAALGDTLALSLCLIGLMIMAADAFSIAKLALVVVFLWFASPTASHMLARLEVTTNENLKEHCEIIDDLKDLSKEGEEESK